MTTTLFCTSLHTGLIQILINLLKILQVVLQQVYVSSRFCFIKIGQAQPQILSKLGCITEVTKCFHFKNPYFYYLKLLFLKLFIIFK